MTTLDFHLEISPGTDHTYPVIARAPDGEATALMRLPMTLTDLDHQLATVRDTVLASSAREASPADEGPVRDLGRQLFEALLTDEVRSLYMASGERARTQGAGVRLLLRILPPELVQLPWEFLFDPLHQDYPALHWPLVRYPEVMAARPPLRLTAPLRILGMVAHPGDRNTLKIGEEQRRLRAALVGLERDGVVELSWVAGQTYGDLKHALDLGPWHVFHFIGHGGRNRATGEGTLTVADDAGHAQLIGADDLSLLLTAHQSLRLVVLHECDSQSGDTGPGSVPDAFSSVAGTLLRRWIPAVVAMQGDITDQATIMFSQTFYKNVATRLAVDTSVVRARRALRLIKKNTLEWGTPRLYLRAPDGLIFDTTMTPPPPADPAPAATGVPEAPEMPEVKAFPRPRKMQTLRHDEAVNAVAFSPDGCWLATASHDETARIWNAASGKERLSVRHKGVRSNMRGRGVNVRGRSVQGVAFSPDGNRLATASEDYTVQIWDAATGRRLTTVTHDDVVKGVVFSPDGRRLLATASDDHTARIWDAGTGRHLTTLTHDHHVYAVVFSPDGRRVATASSDCTARIWDTRDGRALATLAHDKAALGVAFSPDGRLLATAGDDHTARIWDTGTGQELATLPHSKRVWAVAFSPDGRLLATAGDDYTARIWNTGTGQELAILTHDNRVYGVAFSPDGHQLATASRDQTARIWSLRPTATVGDQQAAPRTASGAHRSP